MPILLLILAIATYAQPQPPLHDERDGKKYKAVKIGEQIWMAENLNYNSESSKCFENKPRNCKKYGRLYEWDAAMKSCPNGWRLPYQIEWEKLVATVGGDSIAGKKLKAKNLRWVMDLYGYLKLKDEFGFSALPIPHNSGDGERNDWWTATECREKGRSSAYSYDIKRNSYMLKYCIGKVHFFSIRNYSYVRCIKSSEEESIAMQKALEAEEAARKAVIEAEIAKNSSTFTDARDGQEYRSIKIGRQTWMAENLNYAAEGSACYKNQPENCEKYGRLYNRETAMKVCPDGWNLPRKEDWEKLAETVSNKSGESKSAERLKSKNGWDEFGFLTDGNGTDEFGFSALPGGGYSNGTFSDAGSYGSWWSATKANIWKMYNDKDYLYNEDYKIHLNSVRCLRN